jgi:acyl carrier protein
MKRKPHSAIRQKIQRILADSLNLEVTGDETRLISGGLIDSLGLVELLLQIEREFGVTPDFELLEIEDFETVAAIEQLIVRSRPAEDEFGDGLALVDGTG